MLSTCGRPCPGPWPYAGFGTVKTVRNPLAHDTPTRSVFRHWPKVLGLGLFGYLLYKADVSAIAAVLSDVSVLIVLGVLPLTWLGLLAKAERWRTILADRSVKIDGMTAVLFYFASMFWGSITPGRVGELVRVSYLTRGDAGAVPATTSVLVDRFLDLAVLCLFALYPLYLAWTSLSGSWNTAALVVAALVLGAALLLFVVLRSVPRVREIPLVIKASRFVVDVVRETGSLTSAIWPKVIALTVLSWVIFMASRLALAWALDLYPDPWLLFGAVATASLLSILPVTIQGIGTRDVALVVLLSLEGFRSDQAIALSTLILAVMLVNTGLSWLVHLKLAREKGT